MKRLVLAIALASLAASPFGAAAARRPDECPRVVVSCLDSVTPGTPATFSATINGGDPAAKITFNWAVSMGTISSGQGTSTITVDTTGITDGELKATVEVGGFPGGCATSTSCSTTAVRIHVFDDKIDEYGNLKFADEQARLDNFGIEVQNLPEHVGYIVGYGGRRSRRGEAARRIARAKRYLVTVRAIPAEQLVTIDGGYREELSVELRIRPKEMRPPQPFPTVDPSEVIFIGDPPKRRPRRR